MHFIRLIALLIAAPAVAKKPPPLPPLPPLVLDAAAPFVTVTIDGQPLRLRVDPGTTRHVEVNASAARRLGLANPARLVAGKPVDLGRTATAVGKVTVRAVTSDEIVGYEGRTLPLTVAWSERDPVAGADGLIGPWMLPHDSIRFVWRPATAADRTTHLPMRWSSDRGLLGDWPVGAARIDVAIMPSAAATIATAAAASRLAEAHGGALKGPRRDAVIVLGVVRPVRDVVFGTPADIAGLRFDRVAARVFDWSGRSNIPDADVAPEEVVVAGRTDAQRQWPKLVIGSDHLAKCAEIAWTRAPLAIDLVCPALP